MNDNTCNSIKISDEEKENFPKMNDLYLSKENKRNEFDKTSVHRNINKLKIRNPGIDLIRITGMFCIIIHHILFHGGLLEKYDKFKVLNLINIFCYWHNTSFILISGMVGYKTCKYSNLLFLWLCVLFYSVGIHLFTIIFLPGFIIHYNIIDSFFPIIFSKYWFFSVYFGLYLLLPVVNKGIEFLYQYELKLVFVSTIGIYIIWNYLLNPNEDIYFIRQGNSISYFLIIYITGAYFGKYLINKSYKGIKKYMFYFINLFIYIFSSLFCYFWTLVNIDEQKGFKMVLSRIFSRLFVFSRSSFTIILQTLSIALSFTQIKFNKYISKVISFFGPMIFGVYLIHDNKIIRYNIINNIFNEVSKDTSCNKVIFLLFLKAIKIYVISIIIEIIRHYIFILCRIKKFCIYLEVIIIKLFK